MDIDDLKKRSAAIRDIAMRIGQASEDITLVGGQSVLFWAESLNVPIPPGIALLTDDVDFLASKTDILEIEDALAHQFDCKLIIAGMDESSPNSGKMTINYAGTEKINVDFLRLITGIDSNEIEKSSFPFEVDGKIIHVISPVLLLRSKVSNIGAHLNKRNEEGLAQAHMAIEIAKKYLESRCASENMPYAEFEDIIRFARSDAALYANKFHDIDVMTSIPIASLASDNPFKVKRYPVAMNQIQIKRDKFDDLIERMARYENNATSSRFQP